MMQMLIKLDEEVRHYGLLKILANIEICRRALFFLGTRVSNPSWFLRLIMPENRMRFVDCNRLMWQWQFDELMDGGGVKIIKIAGIPMLKIVRTPTKMKYKLFSALPLYKIKQKGFRRVHYPFCRFGVLRYNLRRFLADLGRKIRFYIVIGRGGVFLQIMQKGCFIFFYRQFFRERAAFQKLIMIIFH